MAVAAAQASVTTTASKIVDPSKDDARQDFAATVHNKGTASIFLGGSDVTTANGYEVAVGEAVSFVLTGSDSLYAVAASGTQRVDVLRTGVGS
jgi:heptaprenylglyceryl phosphate synthase